MKSGDFRKLVGLNHYNDFVYWLKRNFVKTRKVYFITKNNTEDYYLDIDISDIPLFVLERNYIIPKEAAKQSGLKRAILFELMRNGFLIGWKPPRANGKVFFLKKDTFEKLLKLKEEIKNENLTKQVSTNQPIV